MFARSSAREGQLSRDWRNLGRASLPPKTELGARPASPRLGSDLRNLRPSGRLRELLYFLPLSTEHSWEVGIDLLTSFTAAAISS